MGNILYVVAIILIIAWAIGFSSSVGGMIHVLPVVAVIAIIVRLFQKKKIA
jgi:F0F1-type ATP synthase assembly protein I